MRQLLLQRLPSVEAYNRWNRRSLWHTHDFDLMELSHRLPEFDPWEEKAMRVWKLGDHLRVDTVL